MLKNLIIKITSILSIILCSFSTSFAEQSRILSQNVEVNYATPKRIVPLRGANSTTPLNTGNVTAMPAITSMTPTTSIQKVKSVDTPKTNNSDGVIINSKSEIKKQNAPSKTSIGAVENTTNSTTKLNKIAEQNNTSTTKNTIAYYEDVYALSPYAKFLRLGHVPSAYFPLSTSFPWKDIIEKASLKYSLRPELIAAVIKAESDFQVDVVSVKGAEGLMQIMPATQDYLNLHDPFNPELNIMAGTAYLREQLDRFGSEELALAAYNAGPGNVEKYNGIPPFDETENYVVKVLQYKQDYMEQ